MSSFGGKVVDSGQLCMRCFKKIYYVIANRAFLYKITCGPEKHVEKAAEIKS